jgi:ribosome-associated protein
MSKKNSNVPSTRTARQFIKEIVQWVDQKKGTEIVVFDVREISPITDYLIITTGLSEIHNRTIAEQIMLHRRPDHIEGFEIGQWILIDYFDVIVHIFSHEAREFYGLERLWGDAPQLPVNHDTPTP